MKIDTNHLNHNKNVDMEKTAYGNSYQKNVARTAAGMGGISLDISGTVTDNAAYGMGELKSAEEVMQDAGQKDIALQRDYMAVMSNSMSAKDYEKLQEEGISAVDSDIETHVTNLDKIKANLARSGTVIAGYNDDLTNDQIDAISGGDIAAWQLREAFDKNDLPITEENVKGVREAAGQAAKISGLSEDMKKYMVANSIEPTISNLYKAEYSAGMSNGRQSRGYYMDSMDGYYAKKADSFDMDQIRTQVEGIIGRAGLPVNDDTMAEAEWIIKAGLPITERAIGTLNRLDNLTLPLSIGDVIDISAVAINDGRRPVDGPVDKKESDAARAVRIQDEADAITDEAINRVVSSGRDINIRNLYEESQGTKAAGTGMNMTPEALSAKRQLEETRLMMTTEANLKLIKQGISIDTEPLEKLVGELKEAERAVYEPLLINGNERGSEGLEEILDNRIGLYKETLSVFDTLRSVPAEIIGRVDPASDDFTARNLSDQGTALRSAYERAGKSYETLMTAPRADMGDSIRKAFTNVDDILRDNGFELNEANRKAVRILGYSETEINPETINRVRDAEMAVQRVMDLMTPAKTLELIRNGENPIDTNIYILGDQLKSEEPSENMDKYSRFLRKLEEKNEINDREKAAFIGVYRLLRQIEKSDGKLIGNVLSSGNELTLRNLLSASRSNRASGMDLSVDDNFGTLTDLHRRGTSISEQIDNGFIINYLNTATTEALDKISPDAMLKAGVDLDKTLESFTNGIKENYDKEADLEARFDADKEALRDAQKVDDNVIRMLRDFDEPVTVNNLLAANGLMTGRGRAFKSVMEEAGRQGENVSDRLKKAADRVADTFGSREQAKESYDELMKESLKVIEEAVDLAAGELNVKELKLVHKQIGLAGNLSDRQNYEIPVNIEGEWTSINLRLISGEGEEGSVIATMETAKYGKTAAKFIMTGKECRGYITCDSQDKLNDIRGLEDALKGAIEQDGRALKELSFVRKDRLDLNDFAREEGEGADVKSSDLYEVAKAFIKTIGR